MPSLMQARVIVCFPETEGCNQLLSGCYLDLSLVSNKIEVLALAKIKVMLVLLQKSSETCKVHTHPTSNL